MKKIVFITLICSLVVSSVYGVTRLTFEQHALKPDIHNDMVITKFQNPGLPGANQVWDFSNLEVLNDFNGLIQHPNYLKSSFFSNQFNTELIEFGNSFYFNIDNQKIEMTGFRSSDGGVEINYSQPFVKMVYPFEYGSSISGNYSGVIKSRKLTGEITGTYSVEADGYGKLILPNNLVVDNTLRVKTVRKFSQVFSSGNPTEITVTTYRWYTQYVRYPLLVFIETEYGSGAGISVSHQAAFKSSINMQVYGDALNTENVRLYPNPFDDKFFVSYKLEENADVRIEIFDIAGKKVSVLLDEKRSSGSYDEIINVVHLGLKNGLYNVRVTINGNEENHKLMRIH